MNEKARKIIPIVAIALAVVTAFGVFGALFAHNDLSTGDLQGSVNVGTVGKRASDYAYLYVQDGLVANYVGDAKTLTLGTRLHNGVNEDVYYWRNWVAGGEDAVLTDYGRWKAMKGGIGYALGLDEYFSANIGCELPSSISLRYEDMPAYQIELVASFNGLTDENGELVYVSTEDYKYGIYKEGKSAFRFGLVHSFSTVTNINVVGNNDSRMLNRWYVSNLAYNKHGYTPSESVATKLSGTTGNEERILIKNNLVGCPVWLTVGRTEKECPDLYLSYSTYGSQRYNNKLGYLGRELYPDKWQQYDNVAYNDEAAGPISVFNDYPGILYGIRVYNRTLTDDEALHNFFVDLCRYYGIDVSKMMRLSSDVFAEYAAECGSALKLNGITMREDGYDANKAFLLRVINDNWDELNK